MLAAAIHCSHTGIRAMCRIACAAMCLLLLHCCQPAAAHRVGAIAALEAAGNPGEPADPYADPSGAGFDETSVFVNVQRIGGTEMPAVIKGKDVYLPADVLFSFLKIRVEPKPGYDSVCGYFIEPKARYCIDNTRAQIRYNGQVFSLNAADLIQTETSLYVRLPLYGHIFGLNSSFDYSNLTVRMSASVDLPAVREAQLEQMHQNVSRLRGEQRADTVIGRRYSAFNLGFADWSYNALQQSDGQQSFQGGLALGGVLAGGETNVFLNYSSISPLSERQQFYQWRLADNERKAVRQITLGRIFTGATASVYDPVIGVQVTNAPTTYRRSAGSYRLSRTTQPGWTVELYVNNVLVDYVKADASGFFQFDVPLVYGNTIVKLRYYGLFGEERVSEENISIPFNFLPRGEAEYTASAGYVEDSLGSRFGRAALNYGLSHRITIGGGTEYLSSVASGAHMPFVTASARLSANALFSAEYTQGVRGRATLSYHMPHDGQLELGYTHYADGQRAIIYNFKEERKLIYSIPFRTKQFAGITRLMVGQSLVTDNTSYTTAEWLLSGTFRGFGANINTFLTGTTQQDPPRFVPSVYSNVSLAWRWRGFTISPQAQYSYNDRAFISARCELEKYLFGKGYLNLSYEQNFKSEIYSVSAGLRYDLRFGRFGVAARRMNGINAFSENGSGSFVFDRKHGYVGVSNRPSMGRAGVALLAFLDVNGNGIREAGEPKVGGLRARVSSGRSEYSSRDTLTRIYDLEPYTSYFIDVSQNSFENISWQLRKKTLSVSIDPNGMKEIQLPVTVMSEGAGTVYRKDSLAAHGIGRISVCFYREDGTLAGRALSDPDGYYSFMGLVPGTYTARPDAAQLANLRLAAAPASRSVHIAVTNDGVLVEGLNFTLSPLKK